MNLLLVDTGPLVALANRRDKHHAACTARLKQHQGRLLTTWAVLTEFAHLTDTVGATLPLYHWIERYADRPMDLADASLVVAALKTGCTDIWTLDRADFETYRLPGRKHFTLA